MSDTGPRPYPTPVDKLLTHGEPPGFRDPSGWPDYTELGLTREHVPELVRMATDDDLNTAPGDTDAVWAPMHAWRALAQLGASEAAAPLLGLAERYPVEDWVSEELPEVFALLGSETLPTLTEFLADQSIDALARMKALRGVVRLGQLHPEQRERCATILSDQLARHADQPRHINGFLVDGLAELGAVDQIDVIREAYQADDVDDSITGDIEDAEMRLGLRTERDTPRQANELSRMMQPLLRGLRASTAQSSTQPRRVQKVGRNEPCPCGSGKKYKKCCGRS